MASLDPVLELEKRIKSEALTQEQMAEKIGVSPQLVSLVLQRKRSAGSMILNYLQIEAIRTITYRRRKTAATAS